MRKYLMVFFSMIFGMIISGWWTSKLVIKNKQLSDKHLALFLLMDKWIGLKQYNKSILGFFEDNNYKSIAIYGIGTVGKRLIEELKSSGIEIKYTIDKKNKYEDLKIKVITPDMQLPKVDIIVVTAITFFDEIKEMLKTKINCPIISLEDIFDEL